VTGRPVVLRGDARALPLPDATIDLIITSPPYFGLRSYTDGGEHYAGQIGSEATPAEYVAALVDCTREWVRVLKPSGSIFVNLGDKYSTGNSGQSGLAKLGERWAGGGHSDVKAKRPSAAVPGMPPKCLLGLPWRYALACTDQLGLILRAEIIWHKPNGLPESVTDRVRRSHEHLFHFTRQPRYYAAVDEIREPHNPSTHARGPGGAMTRDGQSLPTWGTNGTQSLRGVDKRYLQDPLGKLPGSVWAIPSAPLTVPAHLGVDHFAAFPPGLVRPVVLGWSPPGICTACGEGRRPVTRHLGYTVEGGVNNGSDPATTGHGTGGATLGMVGRRTITGYVCACPTPDAPTRPSLVLDPCGGTGTTALVASVYGRTGITVDMSADYCRIAAWRTTDPGERARAMDVPKPPPIPDGQASLFDDEVTA
jgi:DNA modification methylase